jgi:farnesyl diphosphate synthase
LFEAWVPAEAPAGLGEAMRYAVLGGGKRLRPLLVLGHLRGRARARPKPPSRAAVAVELIHAYSLVHDDMPCMDNDVLRRGKPTVHVAFGEAQAMLAGDAMQALAFDVLTPESGVAPGAAGAPVPPAGAGLQVTPAWPVARPSISPPSASR